MSTFNIVSIGSIFSLGLRNVLNTYAEYENIIARLRACGIKNSREKMYKYLEEYDMSFEQTYNRILWDDQMRLERKYEIERIREI